MCSVRQWKKRETPAVCVCACVCVCVWGVLNVYLCYQAQGYRRLCRAEEIRVRQLYTTQNSPGIMRGESGTCLMTITKEFGGLEVTALKIVQLQALARNSYTTSAFEQEHADEWIRKTGNVYKLLASHFLAPLTPTHPAEWRVHLSNQTPALTHFQSSADGTGKQPWKHTGCWVLLPLNKTGLKNTYLAAGLSDSYSVYSFMYFQLCHIVMIQSYGVIIFQNLGV